MKCKSGCRALFAIGLILVFIHGCKKDAGPEVIIDYDGNKYNTVIIGTQVWMAENLKTTTYNNGVQISYVPDNIEWSGLTTGAYCWYENNMDYENPYGALYNWYAVNTGKLCPAGWHVPDDEEWTTLQEYLISNNFNYDGTNSGNKIAKSLASDTLWYSTTGVGAVGNTDFPDYRNKTGFTAFPGGERHDFDGNFGVMGVRANWWTGTESTNTPTSGLIRTISFLGTALGFSAFPKGYGLSVRCVKD